MSDGHSQARPSVRAPHEEAFEALVKAHRDELTRFAVRALGEHAGLAEDVVQEALLNAHRALAAGTCPEHPRAWLFTIVRNAAVNAVRAAKPAEGIEECRQQAPGQSVAATVEQGEWIDWLMNAVGGLPARQRDALVGHAFEGRSYSEIATRQQTTISAVKSLIVRARRALAADSSFSAAGIAVASAARSIRSLLSRGPLAGKAGGAKGLTGLLAQALLAASVTTGVLMAVHGGGLGSVLASPGPSHLPNSDEHLVRTERSASRRAPESKQARERRARRESHHAVRECMHGPIRGHYRRSALQYAAGHLPTTALEYTECRQELLAAALRTDSRGHRRKPLAIGRRTQSEARRRAPVPADAPTHQPKPSTPQSS